MKRISGCKTPLAFFVVALSIVETFILGVGVSFSLPIPVKLCMIVIGVGLFLVVFATAVWLVVKHPRKLVFSEESHVQIAAMLLLGSQSPYFKKQKPIPTSQMRIMSGEVKKLVAEANVEQIKAVR